MERIYKRVWVEGRGNEKMRAKELKKWAKSTIKERVNSVQQINKD
jgi:hypothetical protein